jgi:glycosyltransferase involved in cell wall biosynthesis
MLTYCSMTMNRLSETKLCVEKYLPYVDKVVIVDGGSIDDTIWYFRNWAKKEPKINFFLSAWRDDFSWQRNNYLKHVPDHTWALVSDPDEVFEENTLQNLRAAIDMAEKSNKTMVGFQCRSVSYEGPIKVWENLDNYWKRLLFKKFPNTHYAGNPHEHLVNHPLTMMDTSLIYEHIKQQDVIWHRGARNLFVGGGGPNLGNSNQRWKNLRSIAADVGCHTWHQFDQYLIKGNIDSRIKQWMREVKDIDGFDGASEHREMYKLYFEIYHPEEI